MYQDEKSSGENINKGHPESSGKIPLIQMRGEPRSLEGNLEESKPAGRYRLRQVPERLAF